MAYKYLPDLWQSNVLPNPSAYVFRETPDEARQTGQPASRVSLVETDWSKAYLDKIVWLRSSSIEAVAIYANNSFGETDYLFLPILWRGNFQKPAEIASVRRAMSNVLVRDERWSRLSPKQSVDGNYHPGMVIFCPDRVSAAMAQRNCLENFTSARDTDDKALVAIVDAQGQVVRPMSTPTSMWEDTSASLDGGPINDVSATVEKLKSGSYAAVNGKQSWRAFRAVDSSPGVTMQQIAASVGLSPQAVRALLAPMVESKVLMVNSGGYYLDRAGRGLLASSQRVHGSRVKKRWGIYSDRGGDYRRSQRLHNQGLSEIIKELRRQGIQAFPALGIAIDYYDGGRLIRVVPDGFVLLSLGVLAALEFEQSAKSPSSVAKKVEPYRKLYSNGTPFPVLFVTDASSARKAKARKVGNQPPDEKAAEEFARLRVPYLMSTTLDRLRQGPQGKSRIDHGKIQDFEPGCWWFWPNGIAEPLSHFPIDLCSCAYVLGGEGGSWKIPLDEPFHLLQKMLAERPTD